MTPRERLLTTLAHREPDRVPVSFGDPGFSGIFDGPPHGYRALCAHLGIDDYAEPVSFQDDCGAVIEPDARLVERLRGDLRLVFGGSSYVPVYPAPDVVIDELGLRRHHVGHYWDLVESEAPLGGPVIMDDVRAYGHWPNPADPAISRARPGCDPGSCRPHRPSPATTTARQHIEISPPSTTRNAPVV